MNKKLVIIGGVIVVVIIAAVLASAYHSGSSKPANNPVTTTGTGANSQGSPAESDQPPAFQGENQLIDIGVTSDQVTNLEQALQQYFGLANLKPRTVSFNSLQQASVNKNAVTPIWTITFNIQLDGKDTYRAKMDYFSLSGIRLYLYALDGTSLLYDSQNVGGSPDSL